MVRTDVRRNNMKKITAARIESPPLVKQLRVDAELAQALPRRPYLRIDSSVKYGDRLV
jgi:hypothetical protein